MALPPAAGMKGAVPSAPGRNERRAPLSAAATPRAAEGAQRLRLAANVLRNFSTLGATTKAQ
jgi:hypothetical protein